MIILIDAGNTRVKLSFLIGQQRATDVEAISHGELTQRLPSWLATLPPTIEAVIGVNVAGAHVQQVIEDALRHVTSEAVQWQRSVRAMAGLTNAYTDAAQLGTDRWLALLGLWNKHTTLSGGDNGNMHEPAAWVLASFGTATTVDAITPAGLFAGGLIVPGPQMMLSSLASGTAHLPLAVGTARPFPTDTNSAIVTGVAAAQAGAVVRQLLALQKQYPQHALRLAVSGGAWPEVADELRHLLSLASLSVQPEFVDNPVLDGLAVVARTAS